MATTRRKGPGGTARGPGAKRRTTPSSNFSPALPSPGSVFGGLEVVRFLGEGGMGHLLLARDRALGRTVAVKFLGRRLLGDLRGERRFRREGRTLASVEHPHVVRVYGVGAWEGWPYLLMEFVEGVSVAARLRDGKMALPEVLRIAEELASALAEVHSRRIVHRDVNPANVMLRGGTGDACLVDFGLSKGLDTTTHSSSGAMGTAFYMSPEQMAGRRQDARVDVYAFGATLFEALTGRTPHLAEEPAALYHRVLNEDAPLLRTLRPEAPRGLEVLLSRCLARAAELRPVDGEALLADVLALRAAVAPAPALPAPTPEPRRATTGLRDPKEPFPMLGRSAETEALRAALEEAEATRGSLLLVEGEAGAGKSRFLREAGGMARSRAFAAIPCEAEEHRESPLGAIRETLLAHARTLGLMTVRALLDRVREVSTHEEVALPPLRWLLERRGDPGAAPAKSELSRAFLVLLRTFLRDRPALLTLDDAHLLDERSLDLLEAAAEAARSLPLVMVLAYRLPDRDPTGSRLASRLPRLAALPGARSLRLEPLSEGAVASLVVKALRVNEAEACRLAPLLHRRSGGNPLYLLESLRLLEEEGKILEDAGGRRLRQRVTRLSLPPRLHEIALRRILALPAREKEVLEAVSVDRAGLPAAVVARCLDESERQVLRSLQELVVGRGLVARSEKGFHIPHAEIREAAYADLLPELRTAYHAICAKALEEACAATTEPARLARHCRLGGEPARAVPLLVADGIRLFEMHAPAEALERFDEALACAGEKGCFEAARRRVMALENLGDMGAAEVALSELERIAGPEDRFDALLRFAVFLKNRGRLEESWKKVLEAEPLADTAERRCRAFLTRAQAASAFQRTEDAREAVTGAVGLESSVPASLRLQIRVTQGVICWRSDEYENALRAWEEALPLAEELGDHEQAVVLLSNMSLVYSDQGRETEAIRFASRAEERATVFGILRPLVHTRLHLADLLIGALRLDEASALLDRVGPDLARLASEEEEFLHACRRAELSLARGRGVEAVEWTRKGSTHCREGTRFAALLAILRAEALIANGETAEALVEARSARKRLDSLGFDGDAEDAMAMAACALRARKEPGPEREDVRSLGRPRSFKSALEAALEATSDAARKERLEYARDLARCERDRRALERVPGTP